MSRWPRSCRPAVERLRVGDLVVPSVRRPCPRRRCLSCRSGHQDDCYTGEFTERGIKEAHGYMTEYAVDYERYMNVVPPDLREIAVLAEPLTIAEKALAQIFWVMQRRPPWSRPAHTRPGAWQRPPRRWCSASARSGCWRDGGHGRLSPPTSTPAEPPPNPRIDLVNDIGATYLSSQTTTFPERPRRSATSTWLRRRSATPTSPCKRCRSWAPTASS